VTVIATGLGGSRRRSVTPSFESVPSAPRAANGGESELPSFLRS
jgi:hypothetical protein